MQLLIRLLRKKCKGQWEHDQYHVNIPTSICHHYSCCSLHLSVDVMLHLTLTPEQDHRAWRDLEVLTLLPTSHFPANSPSGHWKSPPVEASRSTSSTQSRDAILWPPYWMLFIPRLHQIGDKAQPWGSPMATENALDFLLRILTHLSPILLVVQGQNGLHGTRFPILPQYAPPPPPP